MPATKIQRELITGNTYPVKEGLKALGGKWDGVRKGWLVPAEREGEARALVESAGPVKPRPPGVYRPSRCKVCGRSPTQYNRVYRNGVCRECYLDEKEEREMGY